MDSDATRAESLSARGVPAIASQVTRITSHAGLRYQIKQLRRQHPEVDIILIEPQPTDQRMFYGNIMHYQARLEVARHGFESVTLDLAEDYPAYKETLARHGVPITRRLVIEELAEIHNSGSDPAGDPTSARRRAPIHAPDIGAIRRSASSNKRLRNWSWSWTQRRWLDRTRAFCRRVGPVEHDFRRLT